MVNHPPVRLSSSPEPVRDRDPELFGGSGVRQKGRGIGSDATMNGIEADDESSSIYLFQMCGIQCHGGQQCHAPKECNPHLGLWPLLLL